MSAVATGSGELLAALRDLCVRLPVPQPSWHPYAEQIVACRDDLERALATAAEYPDAIDLVAALIDGEAEPRFDPGTSPELTAAWGRLEALPIPAGRHPYLDEILPALDALRLLLVALSQTLGLD